VRRVPLGWGPSPRLGWRYCAPLPARGRPELSGVTVLVLVTVLAVLAAPHAREVQGLVTAGLPGPFRLPELPAVRPPGSASPPQVALAPSRSRAARAVAFAEAQRGKPYRWGAEGPSAYDCSGLTWAAWRYAVSRSPAPRPASSPASPMSGASSSPATWSSTAARARPAGMWRSWPAAA
jgi:hypothetical protein